MSIKTLLRNPGLKLLSLLIAVLLWFHAVTERTYVTEISIPVRFSGIPDSLFIINELPKEIKVTLRGRGKEILFFNLTKPELEIPLRDLKPGRKRISLSPEYLDLPHGENISTVFVEPQSVNLIIDKLSSRPVRVSVSVRGTPPKGYAYIDAVTREKVYLYGPSQIIRDYKVVKTREIDISNHSESFEIYTLLLPPHEMTHLKPESIKAFVQIEPYEEVSIEGVPITIRGLPRTKVNLNPEELEVTLLVPKGRIKRVGKNYIDITIDLRELEPGEYRVKPTVTLRRNSPNWLRIKGFNPEEVVVRILK
jgi:YbbR domain-containing protein